MTAIFLENQRLDISAEIEALLTFSLDDIKEFGFRNTTFSKTIVLPGTLRNNRLFGFIFDVRSSNDYNSTQPNVAYNFNAAKRARCYFFNDNIQTFKGWLRVLEIVSDNGSVEYECAVFGELYGLINAIGRGKLEDLDFSAYNHQYTIANIEASWDNYNAGAGYYYPLIDYGSSYGIQPGSATQKHNWQYQTFRPALFVKEYIDKIFTAAGFTYDCALFGTERFKRLIIPHNQKQLYNSGGTLLYAYTDTVQTIIEDSGAIDAPIPFTTVTAPLFTPSGGNTLFTYTSTGPITVNLVVNVRGTYASQKDRIYFYVRKNGVQVVDTLYTLQKSTSQIAYEWTVDTNISLNTNDTLDFYVENQTNLGTFNVIIETALGNVLSTSDIPVPIILNNNLEVNGTIPRNILQRDFFVWIIKLFNLYVYEDPYKLNHLKIAPYVDYFDLDAANAIDWTHKLDRSQPVRITPMSELNSRFYNFRFKEDADYYNELYKKRYNEQYGDRVYDSEFDFEDGSQDVEVGFSPTVLVGYDSEDKVYSTIMKITNDIEETIDSNIRILQALKVTGVTSWDLLDVDNVLDSYTAYGYAGHLDDPDAPSNDIHFGVPQELFFTVSNGNLSANQFNVYWSSYMAEITDKDSKLLSGYFKLTQKDIVSLDFSKLIYLDGALWRLNKIEDYNASNPDLSKVELLKVMQLTY